MSEHGAEHNKGLSTDPHGTRAFVDLQVEKVAFMTVSCFLLLQLLLQLRNSSSLQKCSRLKIRPLCQTVSNA